jgi:hypothetical protein
MVKRRRPVPSLAAPSLLQEQVIPSATIIGKPSIAHLPLLPRQALRQPRHRPQVHRRPFFAERLSLPERNVNVLLAESGWIVKEQAGWKVTPQGKALGATQKFDTQTGVPYVLWPESLLTNKVLRAAIKSSDGDSQEGATAPRSEIGFREKFRAQHRTTDGHWVRSKAEMLIDNWLYMAGIVHAYERRLPIEEEVYSDFYIPAGKVYIEYWGRENDAKYLARRKAKQELYRRYGLNLIELTDEQIKNLDDELPKLLVKFGVVVG